MSYFSRTRHPNDSVKKLRYEPVIGDFGIWPAGQLVPHGLFLWLVYNVTGVVGLETLPLLTCCQSVG